MATPRLCHVVCALAYTRRQQLRAVQAVLHALRAMGGLGSAGGVVSVSAGLQSQEAAPGSVQHLMAFAGFRSRAWLTHPQRQKTAGPSVWRSALIAAALLAVTACAPLPSRPSAGPLIDVPIDVPPVSSAGLSSVYAKESSRLDVADRIWRLISERFYDPRLNGVDWTAIREKYFPRIAAVTNDAQLYRELKAMVAELRDSHSEVLSPREAVDARRFLAARSGMTLTVIEQQVVLLDVEADSPAAQAGLRAGDVLRAVNNVLFDREFAQRALNDPSTARLDPQAGDGPGALPADEVDAQRVRILRAVRRALRQQLGPASLAQGASLASVQAIQPSTPFTVEIERAERVFRAELRAVFKAQPPRVEFRWFDGVALIRFTRFHSSVRDELAQALEAARPARAIVLDLRGNGGGLLDTYRWFTGQFLPDERVAMRTTRRDAVNHSAQTITDLRLGPTHAPLLQPLVVLVDSRTGSAAELTAVTLVEQRNALLIGEPSCGCVVGVRVEYVLPDGGGLRLAETGFVSVRGAKLEGEPTAPAVRVQASIADLRAGNDVVLDEALRRLTGRGLNTYQLPNLLPP